MKNRFVLFLGILVVLSMLLTACQPAATEEAPAEEAPAEEAPAEEAPAEEVPAEGAIPGAIPLPENPKTITGGWTQEPDNIVPYYTTMSYAVWITQMTLVGLAEWDAEGNLVPELAAEIPSLENGGISEDGLPITWTLKPDLKWSDGEPLTSADVKFTWESTMDPANASLWRTGYDKITSIETPDDLTAVITFSELYPPWATLFTQGPNNAGAILPKHVLEGQTGLESNPYIHWPTVASGAFIITEWVAGDHMQLLPNENYYGGRPILDQILLRFIPTPETALAGLQAGDIDFYPDFSESDIGTLAALEPDIHLKVVPGVEFEHYFFNMGSTTPVEGQEFSVADEDGFCPFKDVRVRKAFIYGINRQAIVDTLLEGQTTVPATQWPNSYWTNTDLTPEPYDMERAIALLEEAGYTDQNGDGIREGMCNGELTPLVVDFETTDKQIRVDIAVAVQSDLAKIGVDFQPHHTPGGTFFASYTDGGVRATGAFDIGGYTTGFYPDPYPAGGDYDCDVASANHPDGTSSYFLCDMELVALFDAVNASVDLAVRKEALDAVQQYIYDQSYVIMMYARADVFGYLDRVVFPEFGGESKPYWAVETWDVTD